MNLGGKLAKIVANRPQLLADTQCLLTWHGVERSDTISVSSDGFTVRVMPFDKTSDLAAFVKPDPQSNGLLMDLSRAPEYIDELIFAIEVIGEGDRSWSLEGLNTGEVWQNDSIQIPADIQCEVLALQRTDEGWQITAREKLLGEIANITVDEQIPEDYREIVARATAQGVGGDSGNFYAILDLTPSMQQKHGIDGMVSLLECLVSIAASVENRPLQLSLHGLEEYRLSVEDDIALKLSKSIESLESQISHAQPLHALVPNYIEKMREQSTLYVITDSMFFLDDEDIETLRPNRKELSVITLGKGTTSFEIPGESNLRIIQISDLEVKTSKEMLELFRR